MRNLKKFLALVLALMMTFSLMVTANASYSITTSAAVTDKDSITAEFQEAVAVLNGLGIITGYEDGTFRPDKPISRQETTALVYRLHSGDVDNEKNDLYSTADNIKQFADVNREGGQKWSAGYIGYCANQGIIKGVSDTRFAPTSYVTGYQVLAMVLRAIGYGQNGEYEGTGWQTRVATTATNLGLLKNINNSNYSATLSASASRELVAEIIFQAALQPTVTYTLGSGYVPTNPGAAGGEHGSLAGKNFNLWPGDFQVIDKWGRPGYKWYSGSNAVATIKVKPAKDYDTTKRECDVAHDLGIETYADYTLYVNDKDAITKSYRIEATDTVTKVGGQGRITEFYDKLSHPHKNNTWPASAVMIDTFLATVTKVTDRVLDPAGHVIVPAYLYLDVHDGEAVGAANKPADYDKTKTNTSEHRLERTTGNWDEYAVNDKILIQGYTSKDQNGAVSTDLNHDNGEVSKNKAAFETNCLLASKPGTSTDPDKNINIVGKSTPVLGKQSVTYWNQDMHTVDGKDYDDALTLFLDVAGTTTGTTYAWYFDGKDNLIGIDYVPNTVNYGVITSIYSAFDQGESATSGTAKAIANVLYADGTTGTITIDRFLVTQGANATYGHGAVNTKMVDADASAAAWAGSASGNTTAELFPVYDNAGAGLMKASNRGDAAKNAADAGWLHVAPVTSLNATEKGLLTGGYYGILKGNMFKFVTSVDGGMTAIEVAGHLADPAVTLKDANGANVTENGVDVKENHVNSENTGIYEWNYNNVASANGATLFKSFSYVALNDSSVSGDIWLDANTRIMVKDNTDAQNVKCYTLSTLPGNVDIKENTEIDWADPNNDGRADYIYVTGTIEGTTTYGLFYYNGGAAQWNGVEKTGTMTGWLNGEAKTLTFLDQDDFNTVKNSQDYSGHLFAIQMINGEVSNLMQKDYANGGGTANLHGIVGWTNKVLMAYKLDPAGGYGSFVKVSGPDGIGGTNWPAVFSSFENSYADVVSDGAGDVTKGERFGLGEENTKWGNPYTTKTEAVYFNDVSVTSESELVEAQSHHVTYNRDRQEINVWKKGNAFTGTASYTYKLTPNTKIIGLGMGVAQGEAVLDYLNRSTQNDVTIVYENNVVKSIVEIYVATDPNVTSPSDPTTGDATGVQAGGSAVIADMTNVELQGYLKSGLSNVVVYNAGAVVNGGAGHQIASQLLYFPFVAPSAQSATLTIKDSSGSDVYRETAGTTKIANGGAYFFTVNFANYYNTDGWCAGAFKTGTYSFTIVMGGVTVSSGTFTLK